MGDSPITQVERSSTDEAPRSSLITQVDRDEQKPSTSAEHKNSTTDPAAGNGAGAGSSTKSDQPAKPKKRNWFVRTFCCCCFKKEKAETASAASQQESLLGTLLPHNVGKKCLVLDLDETLVHSSFNPVPNADFIIPVEIEDKVHQVYVLKRPHCDEFLQRLGPKFEIVVFTASLPKYANPVLDLLDKHKVVQYRLFRDACCNHKGNYVKDLSRIGRDLRHTIIIDNSPTSYMFQPENAVPIDTWFDDESDTELLDLIPFLEDLTKVDDVTQILDQHK